MSGRGLIGKGRRKPWIPPAHWGHTPHIREFLQAVTTGDPAPVPPPEAKRSLELAVALYESALTGMVVTLPRDTHSRYYKGITAKRTAPATPVRPAEAVAIKE